MPSDCKSRRPVTVSIVIHGQWALAAPLLQQLQQHCLNSIDRVVLTVNLPEEGIDTESWQFPVKRIDNPQPLGFGANHNRAFAFCRTPWLLVLNPDIRLNADVLTAILQQADQQSGLLAPHIKEPGKSRPEPYRDLLTPLELLRKRSERHQQPARPVWVAGMFMLLRREAFGQVGGFDGRFFMYCEDFDLCARLRLAGWQLQVGDAQVLHMAQRASQKSWRPLLWHLSSLVKVWTSRAFWSYAALLDRERKL